ncbi:MAG: hypothetical protein EBR82_45140 [Caulobacteraceae bacterium]|nr:hypothetical protein [Caulobacteraceae bacterium]
MKTTQTHTHTRISGPWHYAPGELIYGPDGESVASCRFVTNFKETNVSNMRLVAAAPELLQVAEDFILLADLHDWEGAAIDNARAVIAKAKGAA